MVNEWEPRPEEVHVKYDPSDFTVISRIFIHTLYMCNEIVGKTENYNIRFYKIVYYLYGESKLHVNTSGIVRV